MIEKNKITVLVPAFNEEEGIIHSVSVINEFLSLCGKDYEILLVDDGSSDNTWVKIKEASGKFPVRGIRLSRNFGKEAALRAGLENIRSEYVIIMDADLQHPPSVIPDMVKLMDSTGADVVDGIRDDRGKESLFNRMIAHWFYKVFSSMTKIDLKKASDFKLMNRRAIDAYLSMNEKTLFFRGMSAWIGFRREQVYFNTEERFAGQTKWSTFGLFNLARNAIISFSSSLLHIPTYFGIFFCLFAMFMMVESVYRKFMHQSAEGFPTVIIMLGVIGGLILFSLGIIGEYMAKIYEEVKQRPTYLIGEEISYVKKKSNRNRR